MEYIVVIQKVGKGMLTKIHFAMDRVCRRDYENSKRYAKHILTFKIEFMTLKDYTNSNTITNHQ